MRFVVTKYAEVVSPNWWFETHPNQMELLDILVRTIFRFKLVYVKEYCYLY